jgi:hypothetical protein
MELWLGQALHIARPAHRLHWLKSLDFPAIASTDRGDETILPDDETISRFGADIRKRRMVIDPATKRRAAPATKPGDSQMQILSFILAFAFILAGSTIAGSSDSGLPGIGTFAYNGSPIAVPARQTIMVAAS